MSDLLDRANRYVHDDESDDYAVALVGDLLDELRRAPASTALDLRVDPGLSEEQVAALAALRADFAADRVGLLPRLSCSKCSEARYRVCEEHKKSRCATCGAYISERHIHLDYVGHGAVTERLLDVDLGWNWEPLGFDEHGLPVMTYDEKLNPIGLWVRLTVAGMTRLGFGSCPSGQFEAEKVLIGDAIRNAAMRFGVALGLWIKGHAEDDERTAAEADRQRDRGAPPTRTQPTQQQMQAPTPDPEALTAEERQPYIDDVNAMSSEARDRFLELWVANEDLPTRDRDGSMVPSFNALLRKHVALVEALIARARRDAATAESTADDAKPEPDSEQATTGGADWVEEAKMQNALMADAKSRLPNGDGDKIAAEVWDLHHATLNKQLDEAGEPAREGEPIDVRRMRLVCLKVEDVVSASGNLTGDPEGPRDGEEPM